MRALQHIATHLALVALAWQFTIPASAQLVINEVCSRNISVLEDPLGKHPDWIELHNRGTEAVQLHNYYLSDRVNNRGKWRLPIQLLAPGGYVLFFSGEEGSGAQYFNFGLSSAGEGIHLSDETLTIVSSLIMPALQADHSYGLVDNTPRLFKEPTPGGPNTTTAFLGYADKPSASRSPGFHSTSFTLQLFIPFGNVIRFSLDGRDPDINSPIYNGGITLTTSAVVKAVSSGPDLLPSEIFVGTYLIGAESTLPVISLSTHPDSLWDWDRGIYMLGPEADSIFPYRGANFWRNNHIPGHFEFFDERGDLGLSQRVDLRMHGGSQARTKPQRPFRITARKRYGNNSMEYPFFPERGRLEEYKQLVLRNSGGDFCLANFRDGYWHQISLHNALNVDVLGFRPVTVYLNGAYWGWMNLRERINLEFLANDYGADPDALLLMNQENESAQGDTIHFHLLQELIREGDMNDALNWSQVDAQFDLASFKDYMSLEMFAGNADWPANNVRYWKPSVETGKWRYLLHDLDATMNVYGWIAMDIDMFWWVLEHRAGKLLSEVFRGLLGNDEFKRTFLNRFADLMNTAFREDRLIHEEDLILASVEPVVQDHYSRWQCDQGAFAHHAYTLIPEFTAVRANHVRNHIINWFGFNNTVQLYLEAFPPGAGSVTLNTIDPELPFRGVYFNGNAIDLIARPEAGYVFDHWSYSEEANYRDESPSIRRNFSSPGRVVAYFRREGEDLQVFPNPFMSTLNIGLSADVSGRAQVSIRDARSSLVHTEVIAVGEGMNQHVIDLSTLLPGVYIVESILDGRRFSTRVVKMP